MSSDVLFSPTDSPVYDHIWQRKASFENQQMFAVSNIRILALQEEEEAGMVEQQTGHVGRHQSQVKGPHCTPARTWLVVVSQLVLTQERSSWRWSADARPQCSAWANASPRLFLHLLVYYSAHLNFIFLYFLLLCLFACLFSHLFICPPCRVLIGSARLVPWQPACPRCYLLCPAVAISLSATSELCSDMAEL